MWQFRISSLACLQYKSCVKRLLQWVSSHTYLKKCSRHFLILEMKTWNNDIKNTPLRVPWLAPLTRSPPKRMTSVSFRTYSAAFRVIYWDLLLHFSILFNTELLITTLHFLRGFVPAGHATPPGLLASLIGFERILHPFIGDKFHHGTQFGTWPAGNATNRVSATNCWPCVYACVCVCAFICVCVCICMHVYVCVWD